jgi:hypothetical protein
MHPSTFPDANIAGRRLACTWAVDSARLPEMQDLAPGRAEEVQWADWAGPPPCLPRLLTTAARGEDASDRGLSGDAQRQTKLVRLVVPRLSRHSVGTGGMQQPSATSRPESNLCEGNCEARAPARELPETLRGAPADTPRAAEAQAARPLRKHEARRALASFRESHGPAVETSRGQRRSAEPPRRPTESPWCRPGDTSCGICGSKLHLLRKPLLHEAVFATSGNPIPGKRAPETDGNRAMQPPLALKHAGGTALAGVAGLFLSE